MEKEELKNLTDEQIQEEMDKLRKQIIGEDLDIDVIGNIEEQIDELEAELNRRIETREKMKEEASETKEGNEEMEAEQDEEKETEQDEEMEAEQGEEKETEQDEETKEDKNSEESSKEEKPTPEPEANSNKEDEPKKLTEEQIKEEIEKLKNRNKDLLDRRKKLKAERDKLPKSESRNEEERKKYFKLEKKMQEIFGKIESNNVRLEELREGEPATPDKAQLRELKKQRASLLLIYYKSKDDKKKIDELTAQIDSLKEKIKEEASKTKEENKNPKTNSKEGKKPEKEQRQNGKVAKNIQRNLGAKKMNAQPSYDIEDLKKQVESDKDKKENKNPKTASKEEKKQEKGKPATKGEANPNEERKSKETFDKSKSEQIAKLKEELKKCAERRKAHKEAGEYDQEALEASRYDYIVQQINGLEDSQKPQPISLKNVNEELAKLKEELRKCGERRREYKGFDAQAAMEAAKYSELVEKIHNLEQQKAEIQNEITKLKEELMKSAERRKEYKGFDEQGAMEAANYSRIVSQIRELENGKEEKITPTQKPDQKPGQDSEQTQGQDPEQTPGQDSEQTQGQDSEQTQGQDPEQKPGQDSEQTQGQDSEQTQGQDPDQTLPVKAKKGPFKMVKGLLGAIGRKIAKVFQAIKNSTIGKPFSWLFSRIGNKGDLPEMPLSDKLLKFLQLGLENFVDEEQEFTDQEQNEEEKPTKRKPLGKGQDPEKTHAFASSLFEAMRSAKSQENSDYTEMTFEEDTGKSVETESTNTQSQEKSDVEETKKKVEEGMKSESISYGGCEFTGMSKAIVSKVMEGKVLLHSQLLTTKDGKQVFINPDKTLTAEPKAKSDGPKPRSNGEPKTIAATVDENGRVVEDDGMEL